MYRGNPRGNRTSIIILITSIVPNLSKANWVSLIANTVKAVELVLTTEVCLHGPMIII